MDYILSQAEIIWPATTHTKDGFEHVNPSKQVKTLIARRDSFPRFTASSGEVYRWVDGLLDELKRFGLSSDAAKHHPEEWRLIMNRVRTIRQKFAGRGIKP